jgi:hypothetical protein
MQNTSRFTTAVAPAAISMASLPVIVRRVGQLQRPDRAEALRRVIGVAVGHEVQALGREPLRLAAGVLDRDREHAVGRAVVGDDLHRQPALAAGHRVELLVGRRGGERREHGQEERQDRDGGAHAAGDARRATSI